MTAADEVRSSGQGGTVILIAHGSRDPRWCRPFEALQWRLSQTLPGYVINLCYLQLCGPTLDETMERVIASGPSRITVIPIYLAMGRHVRQDIKREIDSWRRKSKCPPIDLIGALGEIPEVTAAIETGIRRIVSGS